MEENGSSALDDGQIDKHTLTHEALLVLAVFCIVVTTRICFGEDAMHEKLLAIKARPFTLGIVAQCAHCTTLGSLVLLLCDAILLLQHPLGTRV